MSDTSADDRNQNADYLTAGIDPDKTNLTNLTEVGEIIRDFIADGFARLQEVYDGKISAQQGEAAVVTDARALADAFAGKDPDDYTTSNWNGAPLAQHLLATQDASVFTYANPNDPASVVANYLASLFNDAVNIATAHAENKLTDDELTDRISGVVRNAAATLLGLDQTDA